MAKKNFFDKIAEGLVLGKDDKIRELNEEPKKKDSSEDSKNNEKSEEETKDSKEETPKETEDNPESSKEEPKAEAKPEKDEPKPEKSVPEQKPEPAPAPAPAVSYTGAGNVTGMSQNSRTVNHYHGTVEQKFYGSGPLGQFAKETCKPAKRDELIVLEPEHLEVLLDVRNLNKFCLQNEESDIKDAFKVLARAVIQRCPKLFNELVRDNISNAIERDKDLFSFICSANEKKHKVEKRYVAKKSQYDEGPMTEERAKTFIEERKAELAELSEELAATAKDEHFIQEVLVEFNLDTGEWRILSDEEAASYKKITPAEPNKKEAPARESKTEGEAS